MIIGVDFDNVLFPTLQAVLDAYNAQNDASLKLENFTHYNLYECVDSNVADKLLELFCRKKIYDSLRPFKHAVETLKWASNQGHEIFVLTATDVRNLPFKETFHHAYDLW